MKPGMAALVLGILPLLFSPPPLSAQSQSSNGVILTGRVIDANTQAPIPYAMLVVTGDNEETNGALTREDGTFELTTTLGSKQITLSCLGYAQSQIEKTLTGSLDMGDLPLTRSEIEISAVTVKGSMPQSRIEGDGLLTPISGTVLSKVGTAKEVLGFLPGVINNNGSIEIFGKGRPIFYINGRLVRNTLELEQLSSERVKHIKVISNPGARYSADTKGVIRITTLKEVGEGFAVDAQATAGYRDYLYHKENLGLNYRTGGLDFFAQLYHGESRMDGNSTNLQNNWLAHHQQSEVTIDSEVQARRLNAQVGVNYAIQDNHSFGLFYQTDYNPNKNWLNSQSSFFVDGTQNGATFLEDLQKSRLNEHIIDGYYSGKWKDWTADFMLNAIWKNSHSNQDMLFHEADTQFERALTNDFGSRMYALEFHLSRPLWKGSLNMGTAYTHTRRDDDFVGNDLIADNHNLIEEGNAGLYAQLMQQLGKVSLQIGLRYEHTEGIYYEEGVRIAEQSPTYDKLLPSASLVIPIKQAVFQLGYSRKYTRPHYAQLSNTITYTNPYLYETGNPLLKTPYTDEVSLNMRYKWLILAASYRNISNPIITTFTHYGDDQEITLLKKDNSSNAIQNIQAMASIVPGMIGGFYYPVLSVGALSQFYTIDYRGEKMSLNRPMGIIQWNNLFYLPKNYMLNPLFRWRGTGDSENVSLGGSWQIDFTFSKTLNKHWDVKLVFNDIFNTANKNSSTIYGGNRDIQMIKYVNMRSIEFKVGYKLNTTPSKYKGKGAGQSEKDRL